MEDDWGHEPLIKDCLFSEVLGSRSPDLQLPEFCGNDLDNFGFGDLNQIQTSSLFSGRSQPEVRNHEHHEKRREFSHPYLNGQSGAMKREMRTNPGGLRRTDCMLPAMSPPHSHPAATHPQVKVEPKYEDEESSHGDGYSDGLLSSPGQSSTSSYASPGVSPAKQTLSYEYTTNALNLPTTDSNEVVLTSSTCSPSSSSSGQSRVNGLQGSGPTRPRLLIATLPSSLTVIRRKGLASAHDRNEASPSPPSSDGSSPSEGLTPCFGPLRNRSKMHELALKHRLISEQPDPRGAGEVILSPEEKRTLIQEGYTVPSKLPLTKQEEEALKIVRRKIKNKLSAQESRRKRKEYMESLEQRVQGYHTENANLRQKVRQLEQTNRTVVSQLKKLQSLVGGSVPSVSISTQTGVCLTALVFLFAVCIPACPSILPHQLVPWHKQGFQSVSFSPSIPQPPPSPTQHPRASRLLSAELDEEHCDIPYSPGFFHSPLAEQSGSAEEGSEGRHGDDDVRQVQEELMMASLDHEPQRHSMRDGEAYKDTNLSRSVGLTQDRKSCDLVSCAEIRAPDSPMASEA